MKDKQVSYKKLTAKEIFYSTLRKKTYVEIGFSLIIFIALLFFALIPTINSLDSVYEKIKLFKDINSKVNNNVQQVRSLKKQIFVDLKEESDFLYRYTSLTNKDLHIIYYNIFKRAQESNVILESFQVNESENNKYLLDQYYNKPFINVNINIIADNVDNLINFLKSLEGYTNIPIVLKIENFSLTVKKDKVLEEEDLTLNDKDKNKNSSDLSKASENINYLASFELRIINNNNISN